MAQAAAVLCPAGWEEPFGLVAAEANACGTPVVGFRHGGLPEVVAEGVTGILVDPGDVPAAALAVREALALSREAAASSRAMPVPTRWPASTTSPWER